MRWETDVNNRLAYRIGGGALLLALVGGIITTIVLYGAVQDPFADIPAARYMHGILVARNVWLAVHLSFAFLILLKLAGLMSLGDVLDRGPARPLVRMANAFAAVGVALFLVTMVNDGYVHEYMATGWEHAGGGQAMWLPIFSSGIKTTLGMELASMVALLGLAPLAYGTAMLTGSRFPRWLGWLGVVSGIGAMGTAIVLWMTGNTDLGYAVLYPLFSTLLPLIWYVGVGVMLWRRNIDLVWSAGTGDPATSTAQHDAVDEPGVAQPDAVATPA